MSEKNFGAPKQDEQTIGPDSLKKGKDVHNFPGVEKAFPEVRQEALPADANEVNGVFIFGCWDPTMNMYSLSFESDTEGIRTVAVSRDRAEYDKVFNIACEFATQEGDDEGSPLSGRAGNVVRKVEEYIKSNINFPKGSVNISQDLP